MKYGISLLAVVIGIGLSIDNVHPDRLAAEDKSSDAGHKIALPESPRVSESAARRQAEILHGAIHATLQVVHHRYYEEDEGLPLPAAAMQEVFADLEEELRIKLRWLAVEGQAMNTDHKARTPFEHEAAKALRSGKSSYEESAEGVYRRAGPISLTSHCLKCHVPDRKSTETRTAGLIIAIPIEGK